MNICTHLCSDVNISKLCEHFVHIFLQQNRVLGFIEGKKHFVYNFSGHNFVYFCTLLLPVCPKLYRAVIESRLMESIVGLAAGQRGGTEQIMI